MASLDTHNRLALRLFGVLLAVSLFVVGAVASAPLEAVAEPASAVPAAASADDVVVDNTDPGFTTTGAWTPSTGLPNYFGANYVWAGAGSGSVTARWTPVVTVPGSYGVYYWIPDGNSGRAANAPFTVHDLNGDYTYLVNEQKVPGGTWVFLGNHRFAAGSGGFVELSNKAGGTVNADAVKFGAPGKEPIDVQVRKAVAYDWTGEWWLPDDPERKVPGVLSFHPEKGLRLRLIGGWDYHVTHPGENGSTIVTDELQRWPMTLGTADGKAMTLLGVNVITARSSGFGGLFGPPDKMELRANMALVGAYMETPDEMAFTAASADVEDLTIWSRRTGIKETHHWGSTPDSVSGEIELSRLAPLAVLAGPLTVKLSHRSWQPYSQQSRSQTLTRVRESQVIRFERVDPHPLEYWTNLLDGMADLMSLCTLRPCGIVSMRVYFPSKPDDWPEDHPMQGQPHEVDIYKVRVVKPKPDDKAIDLRSYVLTLDDVPFEKLLPRWLEVRDTFAAARSMILGLRYVRSGYIETRVVTAVAAAESMHRALEPAPPIPPDEFKHIRKTLLEAVPPERKTWLADRLNEHSNVPTLKQRLLELVARVGEAGQRLVHDPELWAKAAKDARNNLAHVGTAENDLEHLHAVAEVTAGVVILNLLHELGVPQDRLQKAVEENPVLSYAGRLAREVLCNDRSIVVQIAALNVTVVDANDEPPAMEVGADGEVADPPSALPPNETRAGSPSSGRD